MTLYKRAVIFVLPGDEGGNRKIDW